MKSVGIGTAELLWGILWRSLLCYTALGAVLGGLYGCSIIPVVMSMADASEATESNALWAIRATVGAGGMSGLVIGWVLARPLEVRMPPSTGAVIGLLFGVPVGGFYFVFYYLFAFPIGALMGGTYGLAVGLVNGVIVAVLVYSRCASMLEAPSYIRTVVRASMLGTTFTVSCVWALLWGFSDPAAGELTGSSAGDAVVLAAFPTLVLGLVARWLGGLFAAWSLRKVAATS